MNLEVDVERLLLAQKAVRAELLAERGPGGFWTGQVGSSPLATAAAVSALVAAHHHDSDDALRESIEGDDHAIEQIVQGDLSELLMESVQWLARRQNSDGGWGDCDGAPSNLAATLLVQAAFRLTGIPAKFADLMDLADQYVDAQGGVAALRRRHGRDKALLAPILATCAMADMMPWRQVPTFAFEMFCLPPRWQRVLPMPAARYAAPIALAVGRAKFEHDPPRNPITRLLRRSCKSKALATLERLQAADDSFLASPLVTAFVVMSLASIGCQEHAVVERGVEFLLSSVRADASWSLMSNRSVADTALALDSLTAQRLLVHDHAEAHDPGWTDSSTHPLGEVHHPTHAVAEDDPQIFADRSFEWLLKCQRVEPAALTRVPAGGWAASDAPGSPPNTAATSGVLRGLADWCERDSGANRRRAERAAGVGIGWLLDMQNADGGWPTFYRDNGTLPYDVSSVDETAQALRALVAWQRLWQAERQLNSSAPSSVHQRIKPAIERGLRYLESQQREDGSFVPLWFGNEHQADEQNPVLGTGQVLAACADLQRLDSELARRAARWLVAAQHTSGGWGPPRARVDYSDTEQDGFRGWRANETMAKFCTVEETACAVAALLPLAATDAALSQAASRGITWLINAVEQDSHRQPAVLSYYLSKLWYDDRQHPLAFAAGALTRAATALAPAATTAIPVQ